MTGSHAVLQHACQRCVDGTVYTATKEKPRRSDLVSLHFHPFRYAVEKIDNQHPSWNRMQKQTESGMLLVTQGERQRLAEGEGRWGGGGGEGGREGGGMVLGSGGKVEEGG